MGERTRDEHRSRDQMTSALMTCMHARRRVKKEEKNDETGTGIHRTGRTEGKGGGATRKGKGKEKNPNRTAEGSQHRTSSQQENGWEQSVHGGGKRGRRLVTQGSKQQGGETQRLQAARWGRDTGNRMGNESGTRRKDTQQVQ